jgi:hypothetical protein
MPDSTTARPAAVILYSVLSFYKSGVIANEVKQSKGKPDTQKFFTLKKSAVSQ